MDPRLLGALRALVSTWPQADAARARLEALPEAGDALRDLVQATEALAELRDGATRAASGASFWHSLWDGGLARADRREAANLDPAFYPEEARPILASGFLLAARDGDLGLLWPRRGGFAVYHAHYEGLWCVAPDLATWVQGLAQATRVGPAVIASWLASYHQRAQATAYRLISATGEALEVARACERAGARDLRLAAYARALPQWRLQIHVRARDDRTDNRVRVWRSLYHGPGAGLDPEALALGRRFTLLAHPDPMGGRACALRVEEGVAPHKLAARREALSQVRRRGGDVAVGCCDVDAGPGVLRLEAGSSAGQIKARLQELVRHSQARRFYLCFTGVGGVERQEGVAGRKLTRMASVVARRLAGGGCVEVGPQGQGGASAAPLSWHGAGGGGGRTGQGDSSSSKGIGELEP